MSNNSIKKSILRYVECPAGGLHTGEVMNLVCVDSKCNRRGLICPICRMETHQSHQILPIKTFLQKIRSLFVQSESPEQLNNLTDYLRALDVAKKQILTNLRADVEKLAKSFKDLESKIEQHFTSVRKNVLIQSTITTKLPTLLTLLSQQQAHKDSEYLQQQFRKYTQLLKFENQKLIISDKAKTIVQTYASIPSRLTSALQNDLNDYMKKLSAIPKFFQEKQTKVQKNNIQAHLYTFSSENKYFDIVLEENGKLVKMNQQCQQMGYVFVQQNKGVQNQKITLNIIQSASDSITIGIGDVQLFKSIIFAGNGTMEQNSTAFDYIVSNGYGKNQNANKNLDDFDSYNSIEIKTNFTFGPGAIIQVQFTQKQLRFWNKTTNQKHISKTSFGDQSLKNLQFVVGLCPGDSVRISDQ